MKSWKTTLVAGLCLLSLLLIALLKDMDTVKEFAGLIGIGGVSFIGLLARDNDKRSESVGAK